MRSENPYDLIDELDEDSPPPVFEKIKKTPRRTTADGAAASRHRMPRRLPVQQKTPDSAVRFVQSQDNSARSFEFTYKAARFEQGWLLELACLFLRTALDLRRASQGKGGQGSLGVPVPVG